jgi:hypothetical protein
MIISTRKKGCLMRPDNKRKLTLPILANYSVGGIWFLSHVELCGAFQHHRCGVQRLASTQAMSEPSMGAEFPVVQVPTVSYGRDLRLLQSGYKTSATEAFAVDVESFARSSQYAFTAGNSCAGDVGATST